jgi:small-conductance mechanosensitive channel
MRNMNDKSNKPKASAVQEPPALIGADLIVPVLGAAFGAYYLWSIAALPLMAQFSGIFLVTCLTILIVLLLIRSVRALRDGRARFSFAALKESPATAVRRWGVFALAIGFMVSIEYLGFTLAILIFLLAAMTLLEVRPWRRLVLIAFGAATAGYALFIAALNARLPRGPIEQLLAGLF